MSWADLVVLGIIIGFAIIGMVNGFLLSVFRLVSFFLSAFIAIKFYPVVSGILMKTALYENIKTAIFKNLMLQQATQTPGVDKAAKKAAADTVVENLNLPGFLKNTIIDNIPNPSKFLDMAKIMDMISGEMTKIVIDILSLIVLFILIRIGLIFIKFILQGIAKLPVFKQIDKLGGFGLGAVEGLLVVYIICAVLMLFNSNAQFDEVFKAMDQSLVAKFFYERNFIVDLMFKK